MLSNGLYIFQEKKILGDITWLFNRLKGKTVAMRLRKISFDDDTTNKFYFTDAATMSFEVIETVKVCQHKTISYETKI